MLFIYVHCRLLHTLENDMKPVIGIGSAADNFTVISIETTCVVLSKASEKGTSTIRLSFKETERLFNV